MCLAPPRQKGDRVSALRGFPGEKGEFVKLKECSSGKDSDASWLEAALCLYYSFAFNDVHLFF